MKIPLTLLLLVASGLPAQDPFELRKGDRVCFLGGGLADRMQHFGWIESLLQHGFPKSELAFRNLGFCGDELSVHQRTMNFGKLPSDPMGMNLANEGYVVWDRYLAHCRADVIFAFFGGNEAFAGESGLPKFRGDLAAFIAHVRGQKYNGSTAPRLVLVSPTPFEKTAHPVRGSLTERNAVVASYTRAMAEVAKARGVRFVDAFAGMQDALARSDTTLTINGMHLTDAGYRALAESVCSALLGRELSATASHDRLRRAVVDKNLHWHQRYRVTDGYNVYGGRSKKVYRAKEDGNSYANYDVLQQEMMALDVMVANRDRAIWAIAQGEDAAVDDSNLPAITEVKTNRPGKGPGGLHDYVSGEAGIGKMTPAKGMKVNLFADEARFPQLVNPVQMAWDTRGRLWVAVWPTYPRWQPGGKREDKLLILEDVDGDGKADKCTAFADDLINPTGFEFFDGGVYVASAPDLWFLKDTDGDDKADVRVPVLHGLSSADTHHTANSFVFGPDGALYFQEGTFHMSQVESIYGPVRNKNGCVWRFHPKTWEVDRYIPYDFANPHGHVFDRFGQDFMTDGTGNVNYYALPFSGYLRHPDKHRRYFPFFRQRSRPCAATEILSSSHFPKANQGNLLIANVIGFLGIFQYRFADAGSGFGAEEVEPLVYSSDPNFRPSDIEVGPDGAVYFCDWHNAIIGHLQHHIRDPSRDARHGRVYRVTYAGRPLARRPKIDGATIGSLVEALKSPDDRTRYAARIELSGREAGAVVSAAGAAYATADDENFGLELLWLHQQHGRIDRLILEESLRAKDPRVRAAATRVLRYGRHLVPNAIPLLKRQANDEHPRVRLEAVVAASFFASGSAEKGAVAAAAALETLRRPTDKFLDYALQETLRALEPHWKAALREGASVVAADNQAGVEFVLGRVSPTELGQLPRTPAVLKAIVTRAGVEAKMRIEAVHELAAKSKTTPAAEVLRAIRDLDRGSSAKAPDVIRGLGAMLTTFVMMGARLSEADIRALVEKSSRPTTREVGYALWTARDGAIDGAWRHAMGSRTGLRSMLSSVMMVAREDLRQRLYDRIRPLMFEVPASLREKDADRGGPGLDVAYYSPAPPNATLEAFDRLQPQRTLTLPGFGLDIPPADRGGSFGMVFRGALRVARTGRYEFFTTSDDGSRLFIGSRCVVDNDGHHGMSEKRGAIRLTAGSHPIVVTYFDQGGADGLNVRWSGPGFGKRAIPDGLLSRAEGGSIREAAIRAIAFLPGRDREKFEDGIKLLGQREFVEPATAMIRGVPSELWPRELIPGAIEVLVGSLQKLPAEERIAPAAVSVLELGRELTSAMPPEVGRDARKRLDALGGSTVLIRTVPHKMLYDVTEFTVEAGKPVAIQFENNDMMPHNFVVTKPGAMADVGRAAELLDGKGSEKRRSYIPERDEVLWYTKLLFPGASERLVFVAPKAAGKYPFVCTYPGHWRVMNGIMHVVEAFGEGPAVVRRKPGEGVGHDHAMPVSPARKFVKSWTVEDFEKSLSAGWDRGRSRERGAQLFAEAGCAKCHVVRGKGVAKIGPDLSLIGKKYDAKTLLRQILEPSASILEGYDTYVFEIEGRDDVLGRIIKDDGKYLHVITDFERPDLLTRIEKAKVKDTTRSIVSTMPSGMTVTLKKDEVLELLSYLTTAR